MENRYDDAVNVPHEIIILILSFLEPFGKILGVASVQQLALVGGDVRSIVADSVRSGSDANVDVLLPCMSLYFRELDGIKALSSQ